MLRPIQPMGPPPQASLSPAALQTLPSASKSVVNMSSESSRDPRNLEVVVSPCTIGRANVDGGQEKGFTTMKLAQE
jgi:hypothetical protein